MTQPPTGYEAETGAAIAGTFAKLLTAKHLYQSVQLPFDLDRLRKIAIDARSDSLQRFGATEQERYLRSDWMPCWSKRDSDIAESNGNTRFAPPRIKIFCDRCGTVYPFESNFPESPDGMTLLPWIGVTPEQQVFFLPYRCQGCVGEGVPVIFMVTRKGLKLTLSGRSQMEIAPVPKYLPKSTRGFYQKARVAYDSGQTLAALFLLRTFIEQHMRKELNDPNPRLPGEELGNKYNALLEPEVKSAAPSLKEQYATLSDAIHTADESAPFDDIERRVLAQFEYRDTHQRTKAITPTTKK